MDPDKILVWNVRGLNSSARQDSVRTLVTSSQVDIVCLQETKFAAVSQRVLLTMLGSDFLNYIELPSNGASGGIRVAWRNSVGTTGENRRDQHSISIQFRLQAGQTWWLTCVYGPQGNDEMISFLQELQDIRSATQGPWIIVGDFNLIYKAEDKNNHNYNRAMMGCFRRLIDDLGLKDIPLHGRKFTWSNQHTNPTLVCLDRALCTVDRESLHPNVLLQSAASKDSDHCPLLLGLKDIKPGKKHFHFEAFWPKIDGFLGAVEQAWTAVQPQHCPFLTLNLKFKETARGLQAWSDKKLGHVESQLSLSQKYCTSLRLPRI
jgi:exonuclease III